MSESIGFEKTLLALSEIYISIHEFDLITNRLHPIKSNQFIDALADPVEGAQEKLNNVMRNITVAEHLNDMMEFIDLSTVSRRTEGKKDVSIVFMGKIHGWCRARFVVADYTEAGVLSRVLFTVECINEEKLRENHLLYLSQTDLLTGIYNRGHGEKSITELIQSGIHGMFVIFDVDKFKRINDCYGHQVGDQVLIEIASALKRGASEKDIVMRLGGDEFAGYFPGVTDREEGKQIVERLFEEFGKIKVSQMKEPVEVSLGARFSSNGQSFDDLYKSADKGVYASKNYKGSSFDMA